MHKFYLVLLFLTFIIFACHEDEIIPPPNGNPTDTLTFIGFRGKYALDLEYEEPFLYACAGPKGVWKKNISTNSDWQYLGLEDTSFGNNTSRGALNIDVNGNNILVAYNGPNDTCRPDQCVGIWGSTNGGTNWFRSDNGIPESIIDTFEYNAIHDLERSTFNPNRLFAIYGPALYVSTDNGSSWALYGLRGFMANKDNVRWNPMKENELWAFGETSTFAPYLALSKTGGISFDFGVDFVQLGFPNDGNVSDIAFDQESSLIIYVVINRTLIKSTDGGKKWITAGFSIPGRGFIRNIIEDKKKAGVIFMGGLNEVFYTKDGGSKIYLLTQLPNETIISLEIDNIKNILFIGTNDGIYSYNLNTIN
jgi:hypothetical protein